MVPKPRINLLALFLGVIVVLSPNLVASAQSHLEGTPAGNLYQDYATQYFLDRSVQFAKDMLIDESYLAVLTESVVKEIKARNKEGTLHSSDLTNHAWASLPAFSPFDPNQFKDRRINKAYPAWERSQFESFFRSWIQVEEIHNQLIRSASPTQKQRMFRIEYARALQAYADEKWELAILSFDGILNAFGYRTVDDILFYRSESCLQLGYFYQAFEGYQRIISDYPESSYGENAIVRAVAILDRLRLTESLKQFCQSWESKVNASTASTQDLVHFKLAQIYFLDRDYDQTISHATLISSAFPDRNVANSLLASSWALKGDYIKAIPLLQAIIADRKASRAFRDDATVKLAAIYFDLDEYQESIATANRVPTDSPLYPRALLIQAWGYFRQDDFQNTINVTSRFLKYYPSDESVYEAASLEACAQQSPAAPESGKTVFQNIMDDAAKSWSLEAAAQERQELFETLQDAIGLEEAVFMDGRKDLFEQYVRTRSDLTILAQRLRLYEVWEANAKLRPVLTEDREVTRVARELHDVSEAVKATRASSPLNTYVGMEDKLSNLHGRLGSLYEMLELSNPPYMREYESKFDRDFSGRLMAKAQTELDQLENSVSSVTTLMNQTRDRESYAARFALEQERRNLGSSLNRLDTERTELGGISARPALTSQEIPKTHLEEWAEFGFRRTFLSGGLLNRYSFSLSRIDDLNRYLNTIELLLSTESAKSDSSGQSGTQDSTSETK